jgi:hypothetical protein
VRERKCEGRKIQRVKKHHSKIKITKNNKNKKIKIKTPHTKPNIYLVVVE